MTTDVTCTISYTVCTVVAATVSTFTLLSFYRYNVRLLFSIAISLGDATHEPRRWPALDQFPFSALFYIEDHS